MKLILAVVLLAVAGSPAMQPIVKSDRVWAAYPGFHDVEGHATALAAVPASSPAQQHGTPDAEATVYLLDDYSKVFDLIYTIHLTPQPKNASWSTLGIMLIGTDNPGPSIQVGLAQENATTIKVFTTIGSASGVDEYNGYPLACVPNCELELRGDADNVTALVSGQVIGNWPRSGVPLQNPYVQINGEVNGAHDAIDGSVMLKSASVGGVQPKPPACGYTRGGIAAKALPDGTLAFSGTRDDGASTYYYSIFDGHKGAGRSEIPATSTPT
jgi:hypothetical protein